VVQNGNAYEEGLDNDFWKPLKAYWEDRTDQNAEALRGFLTLDGRKWQYTHGVRHVEAISPDTWTLDQTLLDRPGNKDIQLALFYDYRTNVPLYPTWHAYFRKHQPPTGLEDPGVPPARHGPFRPGGRRQPHRQPHAGIPAETRGQEVNRSCDLTLC
jgi:hypothetical protein